MAARILVADDDQAFAHVLTHRLEKAGYEVHAVHEGIRVMEACRRLKPDLLIIDLRMPTGGGVEILGRIKKDAALRKIPVVMISGTFPEAEQETVQAGAAAFFPKPFDPEALLAKLQEILGR